MALTKVPNELLSDPHIGVGITDTATSAKLAVSDTGIDVTGDLSIGDATPQILMTDSDTSSTFKIALDGVSTNVTNSGTNGEVAFHTFNGEKLRLKTGGIDVTGSVTCDGLTTGNNQDITVGGVIKGSDSTFSINTNTADGSDSSRIRINGGGGNGDSRGAQIELQGNEHTFGGTLLLASGSKSTSQMKFNTAGQERMVITSTGNVGIGQSSPASQLHLTDTSDVRLLFTTDTTGHTGGDGTFVGITGGNNFNIRQRENAPIDFYTNNQLRLKISNTGKVGIGVTPKAWHSSLTALQVGGRGALHATASQQTNLSTNVYANASNVWTAIATDEATMYQQDATGQHVFFVAGSTTADTAISWTTAMTIKNDGNVDVTGSVTSPDFHSDLGSSQHANRFTCLVNTTGTWTKVLRFDFATDVASWGNIIVTIKHARTYGQPIEVTYNVQAHAASTSPSVDVKDNPYGAYTGYSRWTTLSTGVFDLELTTSSSEHAAASIDVVTCTRSSQELFITQLT